MKSAPGNTIMILLGFRNERFTTIADNLTAAIFFSICDIILELYKENGPGEVRHTKSNTNSGK